MEIDLTYNIGTQYFACPVPACPDSRWGVYTIWQHFRFVECRMQVSREVIGLWRQNMHA